MASGGSAYWRVCTIAISENAGSGGSEYWRVCIIAISENPGYSPLDFPAGLSPWIHLAGSSQFNPSWTLLIFLLPGSYTYIPRFVIVNTGIRRWSAISQSVRSGWALDLFG
jgi:hypothetical protein